MLTNQAFILTCKPGSQFHWGKPPLDDETALDTVSELLHSDTIFAALVDLAARIDDQLPDLLKQWSDTGLLRISSAFALLQFPNSKNRLFFLPKPATLYVEADKRRRKITFVSAGVWENGVMPEDWDKLCVVIQHKYVALKTEIPMSLHESLDELTVLETATFPKVAVHKISKEDSIYFQTNLLTPRHGHFTTNFYFLLGCDRDAIADTDYNRLIELIGLLVAEGLGGERSTGCGVFQQVLPTPFPMHLTMANREQALLSLYLPLDHNEFKNCLYYRTVIRGGRRITGGALDRIKMIGEGAILSGQVQGKIVELQPSVASNPHWRSGIAFSLPVHTNFATTNL